jgi:uncharacterized membrane protein
MRINNVLQPNNWNIKKFLRVVFAIQLALLGVISLNTMGLQIPLIRQFIGFVFLIFVPGIIILRILKLHKLNNIETVLYTIGLSLATLMFTGLLMNTVFPILGISEPISTAPLIITITAVVSILCVLCYIRDKDYVEAVHTNASQLLSSPVLFLCMIPFLAVFRTYLVNFYENNLLLILMFVIISAIVLLIGFDIFIQKKLYPLAIFIITISLLFHNSLISNYIWGWDIHYEYYISNNVLTKSVWDSTIPSSVNAMLSVVMLIPIFSDITGMNITWVLKIIYPLLFSFLPLGLYSVFQKQTNDKIAFIACFFFVSVSIFYTEMLTLARQQIAELFLILLILLMIDKDMDKMTRSFLFIVFSISLAVSHYGLSYIFMAVLISAWLLLVSSENPWIQQLMDDFYFKIIRRKDEKPINSSVITKLTRRTISSNLVMIFVVFTLIWYMNISGSASFNPVIRIGNHIISNIRTDFLNPESVEGLSLLMETGKPTLISQINRIINYLNQIFIIIGVLILLIDKNNRFGKEYTTFSMLNLIILFFGVSVPFFASALNMTRLYHITIIFLAPFCVIGGIVALKAICKVGLVWTDKTERESMKVLSVYFIIFFLYQTGFLFQIVNGTSGSISLDNAYDSPRFNDQEVLGAKWLTEVKSIPPIYADDYRLLLLISFEWTQVKSIPFNVNLMAKDSYLYFGTLNTLKDKLITRNKYVNSKNMVYNKNKIYTNGGTQVYY